MITEEVTMSHNMARKSKLVHPKQPYHNDFLETMGRIFRWSRFFGVAGPENVIWKLWGILMLFFLVAIECGAVYKLIKLLLGLAAYSAGNRSVTARLAGTIFYTSSTVSLILSWRLSSKWSQLADQWNFVEKRSVIAYKDDTLKKKMLLFTFVMVVCSAVEHGMSVIAAVEFECPPHLILEKYILESHAFIFVQTDYSLGLAIILLFMSNIATILWNFQDLLIVLVSMGLASRYKRLNQCVANARETFNKDIQWNKNTEVIKIYTWRKIRDAYVKQAQLVRSIDSAVGGLILLSSSGNFYFICLQLFLGITQGISTVFIKRIYYLVSLAWICARFSCMVLAAAEINVQSRQALKYIHICNSRSYNIEVERLQKQLSKDFVALSGKGFFYIDRTLLLSVASAVITYELVLVQFDTKGLQGDVPLNLTNSQ